MMKITSLHRSNIFVYACVWLSTVVILHGIINKSVWFIESAQLALIFVFVNNLGLVWINRLDREQNIDKDSKWPKIVLISTKYSFYGLLYAYAVLTIACWINDYSVSYIWENSHDNLPWWYKLGIGWAGHEGSWLLWWLMMAGYIQQFVKRSTSAPSGAMIKYISYLNICFGSYAIWVSSPFERILPMPPAQGRDLNPLLQDAMFTIHPPCLYMGYVGLVIPYLMSMSYMHNTESYKVQRWMKEIRIWGLWVWSWLTLGISLGSWWAYKELGWGGWWFWDPVENLSLIPWLATSALLHATYQPTTRAIPWVLALAISGFLFSIVGTMLIRSGLLVSVHSFVNDPVKGVSLLLILSILLIITIKDTRNYFVSKRQERVMPIDIKSTLLNTQNTLLLMMLIIIATGTIYPIIYASYFTRQIAVGEGYYEQALIPCTLLLIATWSIYSMQRAYKKGITSDNIVSHTIILACSILANYGCSVLFSKPSSMLIIALWVVVTQTCYVELYRQNITVSSIIHTLVIGAFLVMCMNKHYESSWTLTLKDSIPKVSFDKYKLQINTAKEYEIDNYVEHVLPVELFDKNSTQENFKPSLRYYPSRKITQSKASSVTKWWGDWMVVLTKPVENGPYILRIYLKPFQAYIWMSGIGLAVIGMWLSVKKAESIELVAK